MLTLSTLCIMGKLDYASSLTSCLVGFKSHQSAVHTKVKSTMTYPSRLQRIFVEKPLDSNIDIISQHTQ